VQVDPTGHAGEGFRVPLFGGNLETDVWGQDIFEDESFHRFRFRYEIDPSRIDIRPNSFAAKWEDWEELLARGNLVAYDGSTTNDVTSEVRKLLHSKVSSNPELGAALRWCIQAKGDTEIRAVLQSLPRPAGYLRKDSRLTTDFCGAIELFTTRLRIPLQEDQPCRGPIPVLFSRDVDKAKDALISQPEQLHQGMYDIKMSSLFMKYHIHIIKLKTAKRLSSLLLNPVSRIRIRIQIRIRMDPKLLPSRIRIRIWI
jgi:hypothetical protein